jgi:hypothetical protein
LFGGGEGEEFFGFSISVAAHDQNAIGVGNIETEDLSREGGEVVGVGGADGLFGHSSLRCRSRIANGEKKTEDRSENSEAKPSPLPSPGVPGEG